MAWSRLLQRSASVSLIFLPLHAYGAQITIGEHALPLTHHWLGIAAVLVFFIAYLFVITEELTDLRKSKPVVFAAGIIWVLLAIAAVNSGFIPEVKAAVFHNLAEYGQLLLFLIVAMSYLHALEERGIFQNLSSRLIARGLSYRKLFWITGGLAFFISPLADNLTTAMITCAIVLAVAGKERTFVKLACINIVVAANAGGAFSPFGDITTLMVWQLGAVQFSQFFYLFIPAMVNFVVPALCMHFAVPKKQASIALRPAPLKYGAKRILLLFSLTILTTVLVQHYLELPPALGMMTGLGYLKIFGYFIRNHEKKRLNDKNGEVALFDVFQGFHTIEWDTLLFFYGVMMCVGGLATFGYLEIIASGLYETLGGSLPTPLAATPANVLIGLLSALVDNIPVMYAVLTMNPTMSVGQWLLVTLTAGVGGSLLSIGSAAGVALMGQAKGTYTFTSHLKWLWAILLGYALAIIVHLWLNSSLFY
jgi:Na+/H+ antiporter NhaD/arsenite permease-like protein